MITIVLTLVLVVIALFVKGCTRDLLQSFWFRRSWSRWAIRTAFRRDWRKKDWRKSRLCFTPKVSRAL